MKSFIGCFIGLLLSVHVGAEPLLEGWVRLSSGQPAAGAQVQLFDLTDLRRFVGTTTDETGHFALSLRAFSTARSTALPTGFALGQNYPNPFNPSTIIPYQLSAAGHVRLDVYNMLGQRLATLVDGQRSGGMHTAQWDATDASGQAVGAGVYIYRLSSGGMTESRRMVLVDGQAGVPLAGSATQVLMRTAEDAVEMDGSAYGLTVSGEGLVAYVNPAFRVGVDQTDIVLEEHSDARLKLAAGGLLGDVDGNGHVDVADVLFVMLYSQDSSIVLPNNGDISRGDVNEDGKTNLTDALLLLRYISDPFDPTLPEGIGQDPNYTPSAFSRVYWTDWSRGTISRTNLDGSGRVEPLVSGLDNPLGLALDVTRRKMYWTDYEFFEDESGKVQRANLDGSGVETLVTGLDGLRGIALDVAGGKMYWTSSDGIWSANLDGTEVKTLNTDWGASGSRGIALDIAGGKMYWANDWTSTIRRANLDGSGVETLVSGLESPQGIALDIAGGKMYWADEDWGGTGGTIQRANLDGTNIEILVSGLESPQGIALYVANNKLYWTQSWGPYKGVNVANLDGTNIETLVSDVNVGLPGGIALGP